MDGLHLTTAHQPTDIRIFNKEAISLADAGFDIGILAHNVSEKEKNNVQFYDLGSSSTRVERWCSITKVAQTARRLDASIYHFHDPELIPVGLYLSATTDSAIVYDVHENYGHKITGREWVPNFAKLPLAYSIPRIEQFAAGQFDAITTATKGISDRFLTTNGRVVTLHNFPRISNLPSKRQTKNRKSDHVLCYVGGLDELRGIYRMICTLDILNHRGLDVELWALGSWSADIDRRHVEEFISNRDLGSQVQFPGHVGYKEMFRYLYSADVGLSLLDTKQFEDAIPTKQFEYLCAGLPIVTTPLDAAIKYLPEKFRHTIPQGDTEATADAVETALTTDYNTAEMRSLVQQKYNWEAEAESLIALYNDLL